MIVITLDSHILSKIANDTVLFEKIYKKTEQLYISGKLIFQFSPIVFIESLKGVKTKEHFKEDQNRVRIASKLCNKHFLPDTANHLRKTIGLNSEKDAFRIGCNWIRRFHDIATCDTFEAFTIQHLPFFAKLGGRIEENHKSMSHSLIQLKKYLHKDAYKTEEFMDTLRRTFLDIAIDHFDLKSALALTRMSINEVAKSLPGLTFFSFSYASLVKDCLDPQGRKEIIASDYCDMIQTVYLDVCDYIVSNDSRFARVVNSSGLKELEKRIIPFEEFLSMLDFLNDAKKAPLNPSFLSIPPQQ
ncbi:MAG: hypothetical protein KAR42_03385 [candidate division Zixibacteria bacterium]|nr:hypothetical protein [candidate division Zixibacteria bacterium]